MRSSSYFKTISRILILAMLHLCWLTSYGYAEMVPTESAIEQPSTSNTDRQRLLDLLKRQEVVDELQKYGISKVEATARFNSLTDEEVTQIAGKLDELPAGGETCITKKPGGGGYNVGRCESSIDGGVVVAVILVLVLLFVWIFYWLRGKNKVDYPSSKEEPASVPVEEDCDPGLESCT